MAFAMTKHISATKIITHKAKKVRIADIETELDSLWAQFNKSISGGQTVMRACMSNLIIYCESDAEAKHIIEELICIVDVHPARILLLTAKTQQKKQSINAYVSIYYMSVPDGLQVCAERIDVVSTAETVHRLPSVARSQLIGDLPTALWWASTQPPPEAGEVFFQLAELADQIIYDNMGWPNPIKGVAAMTRWVASQQDELVVYNLAWRRTATWRKLISQVLDPRVLPEALTSIRLIEIDHGPHALAMSWLLVGWLACRLNWQPTEAKPLSNSEMVWRFKHNGQYIKIVARRLPEGEPLLYRLLFDWSKPGQEGRTCFERLDDERIGIAETLSTDAPRVFSASIPKRSSLVSAQLAHRERDKVFQNALSVCNTMSELFQK
jgi:glucose-6-phosphate dehydrogenase assembly protein OpcA